MAPPRNLWNIALMVALVLGIIVPSAPSAQSQEPTKVYRIGFLAFGHRPVGSSVANSPLVAFRQSLRELAYVEGRNLVLEERWAGTRLDRLPFLAAELVRFQPDVIVASGGSAVRAAMQATQDIPIVIAGSPDPVGKGLVASLAHPGGNVTGVTAMPGRVLEPSGWQQHFEGIESVPRFLG